MTFNMCPSLLLGLLQPGSGFKYLLGGMQLNTSAFRNGFDDGTIDGRAALAVLGQNIQKTAVTEQQFRDLILKGL
ncbi:hypothetical protein GCM10010912_57420 [Paenibacillus albidus]|uniref:Uncharacterized protein n=1 Tax=Paenibacillus albidus TaxID=2041023 RepID=A0A917FVJ3_9BACL|nr:hypothetical protein GCM10010912_57420 [Paenibacillus albidus]